MKLGGDCRSGGIGGCVVDHVHVVVGVVLAVERGEEEIEGAILSTMGE